jgi:hypothetical protein
MMVTLAVPPPSHIVCKPVADRRCGSNVFSMGGEQLGAVSPSGVTERDRSRRWG